MIPLISLSNRWPMVTQVGIVQSGEDAVMHVRGSYGYTFRILGRCDYCGLGNI